MPVLTIEIIVPSYHRPEMLERCLSALKVQSWQPERVIVVARHDDLETRRVTEGWQARWPRVVGLLVEDPGVIAAMSVGVAASVSDVVAFTDDDAEPRSDWIARILPHFEESAVGGVGGRDVVAGQETPLSNEVGRFTRFGKLVGNHHLGYGQARCVDVLKGVNMAFRAQALSLPRSGVLWGTGAQAHFEILVSGYARRNGWRLVYDPSIVVDHEIGARLGADARWKPKPRAVLDAAFNSSLGTAALSDHWFSVAGLYSLLVGSRGEPGLGRAMAALVRCEGEVARRAIPGIVGHGLGLVRAARGIELEQMMVTTARLRASNGADGVVANFT